MYDTLFINRNKTVANLIKLGDCLGRSIRENILLFKFEPETKEVAYITETRDIIKGEYSLGDKLSLDNISIEKYDDLYADDQFEDRIEESIDNFVGNIFNEELTEANTSFTTLLSLWEDRAKLSNAVSRLEDKALKLEENESILDSTEFSRLVEIEDSLVKFLKENTSTIEANQEIKSSIRLANTISNAFNIPLMEASEYEGQSFEFMDSVTGSIYDLLCQQELVKKELLETKKNFESMWTTDSKAQELVSYLISEDNSQETLCEVIAECIKENPYFALASKKNLTEMISNLVDVRNLDLTIDEASIKKLSSEIFELKKPIKEEIIAILSQKYGVNVQNLKEDISFSSLGSTLSLLMESLSKISPNNSIQKGVLLEFSKFLSKKSGVECIDLSDYLSSLFVEAGYNSLLTESVSRYMNFDKVASDLDRISGMLKTIMAGAAGGGLGGGQEMPGGNMPAQEPEGMTPYSNDPEMGVPQGNLPPEMPTDDFPGDTGDPQGEMGQEIPGSPEGMEGEEQFEELPQDPQTGGAVEANPEDLMGNLGELESLISDLKHELGGGDEEVVPGEEEEEEMIDPGLEDEEMPVEGEEDMESSDEDEDEEEEEFIPKKGR